MAPYTRGRLRKALYLHDIEFQKKLAKKVTTHTRLLTTSQSLMMEEKFDTWLDLRPLLMFQGQCLTSDAWDTKTMSLWEIKLTPDTCCLLRVLKVHPREIAEAIVTPTLPSLLIHYILVNPIIQSNVDKRFFAEKLRLSLDAAWRAFEIQYSHILSNIGLEAKELLDCDNRDVWETKVSQLPAEVIKFLMVCEDIDGVVHTYRQLHNYVPIKSRRMRAEHIFKRYALKANLKSLKARVTITADLILLEFNGRVYLLNNKLLLEIHNKLHETANALIYSYFQSGTSFPMSHYDSVVEFLSHLSYKVSRYTPHTPCTLKSLERANNGFKYLKAIEGIGVSEIIYRNDFIKGWDNQLLTTTLWGSLYEDNLVGVQSYRDSDLNDIWKKMSSSQIAEVLGLVKLCGHPSIEVENGLRKLYTRTHNHLEISQRRVYEAIGLLTRDVTKNFFRKHKRFPKFQPLPRGLNPLLQRLLNQKVSPTSPEGRQLMAGISNLDWSRLTFAKNSEFDRVDNQLPLLKDKALGLTRSKVFQMVILPSDKIEEGDFKSVNPSLNDVPHLHQEKNLRNSSYKTESHQSQMRKSMGPWMHRRALLKFLLSSDFTNEFNQYLDDYQNEPEWTSAVLDYLVIKLTPKELEEKPEGRMFGASPAAERNRRIVQEFNVMNFMDNYIPDQLMTPNELLMIKKLFSFRHFGRLYPNHTTLQVSFDFSRWNNNMRSESIDIPASRLLDSWFDTKIYAKTMKAYENSVVYHSDMLGACYWNGQLGGIEGLNQATWSLIFLGGVKQALEQIGVVYQVTVKGDDVRAALVLPQQDVNRHGIEAVRIRILEQLQLLCRDMGWELNPQESFVSITTICTSKQYQVNDTWLSASAKKMMKAESLSNLIFPTIEDIISNVYSTCHSACSQATVVFPAYVTASVIASRLLVNEYYPHRTSSEYYTCLLLWPQVLSGPGCLPLQTFFIRGENDMLSVSISIIRHILLDDNYQYLHGYFRAILSKLQKVEPDQSLLLADPYSIPITAPPRPSTILKQKIKDQLVKVVRNPDLLAVLSFEAQEREREFKLALMSMTPYYPKLATVLWEASPFYLTEEVVAKFTQSSTIVSFLSQTRSGDTKHTQAYRVLQSLLVAAEKRYSFWETTLATGVSDDSQCIGLPSSIFLDPYLCSTDITQRIRDTLWGKPIKGITYPSLVDQNIILTPNDVNAILPGIQIEGYFSQVITNIHVIEPQVEKGSHHYSSLPNSTPWLGSQTTTKMDTAALDSDIVTPTIAKIKKLITLRHSGCYFGAGFVQLVDSLLYSYTSLPLNDLLVLSPESGGGHLAHRVQVNSFSMTTMPNMRPNIFQLTMLNDESLRGLQTDPTDRTINYAARHFYLKALTVLRLQSHEYLSPQQPLTLNAIFHGRGDELGKYELCPHCNAIVHDEIVTFSHPTILDLTVFRTVPMVGASSNDEMNLQRNMVSVVMGKARRLVENKHLDPDNPRYTGPATRQIINRLSTQFQNIYREAQSHNFSRIPTGALLDIISTCLGFKSLGTASTSLNVIRSMDPEELYDAVVTECLQWVMEWFIKPDQLSELDSVRYLLPHTNPLTGLFDQLINAGVMRKLIVGSQNKGYLTKPLIWDHASTSRGHAAAQSFILQHQGFLEQVIYSGGVPSGIKIYVQMEDNQTIYNSLFKEYEKLIYYTIKIILGKINYANVITHLYAFLQSYTFEINNNEITALDYFQEHEDQARLTELAQHFLHRARKQVDRGETAVYFICIYRWYIAVTIHEILQPADWIDLFDIPDELPSTYYDLATLSQAAYPEYPIITEAFLQDNPGVQYIRHRLSPSIFQTLHLMISQVYQRIMHEESFLDLTEAQWEFVQAKFHWYNRRFMSVMNNEDAERILKQRGIDLHDIEKDIDQIDYAEEEDYGIDKLFLMQYDPAQSCKLGLRNHVAHKQANLPPLTDARDANAQTWNTLHDMLTRFLNLASEVVPLQDWSDIYNIMPGMNSGSNRLMFVLEKLGLYEYLQQSQHEEIILSVGDGGGCITGSLLRQNNNLSSIFVSLMIDPLTFKVVDGAPTSNPPVELLNQPMIGSTISRCHYQNTYPGNISDPTVQDCVHRYLDQIHGSLLLAFSDMDKPKGLSTKGYSDMLYGFFRAAFGGSKYPTLIILKLSITPDSWICRLIYFLYTRFAHHHLIITPNCRFYASDVYLILSHIINEPTFLTELYAVIYTEQVPYDHVVTADALLTAINRVWTTTLKIMYYSELPKRIDYQSVSELTIHIGELRSWAHINMRLNIESHGNPNCLCQTMDYLLECVESRLHRAVRELVKTKRGATHRGALQPKQSYTGQIITTSSVFTRIALDNIIKFSLMTHFFAMAIDEEYIIDNNLIEIAITTTVQDLINFADDHHVRLTIHNYKGVYIVSYRHMSFNLTEKLYRQMRRLIQTYSWFVTALMNLNELNNSDYDRMLQSIGNIPHKDCCNEFVHQIIIPGLRDLKVHRPTPLSLDNDGYPYRRWWGPETLNVLERSIGAPATRIDQLTTNSVISGSIKTRDISVAIRSISGVPLPDLHVVRHMSSLDTVEIEDPTEDVPVEDYN